VGGSSEGNFSSITKAVENASDGDTVFVLNGTYYENLVIDKKISLIGEDRNTTKINGFDKYHDIIRIIEDDVDISGFSIQYGGNSYNNAGIKLESTQNCTISNNNFIGNIIGVYISSDWNKIINNYFQENIQHDIYIVNSDHTIIKQNEMIGKGIHIKGYLLEYWNTHEIDTSNTLNGNPIYFWKDQIGGTIPPNASQIILANCTNVIIENQKLQHGYVGIELGFSSNNNINRNNLSFCTKAGIYLQSSIRNNIVENILFNNGIGIDLYNSNYNGIKQNIAKFNNGHGISLDSSNWNNISENNISFTHSGLFLKEYIHSGIYLKYSRGNNIIQNFVSNNKYGIYFDDSSQNNIIANMINSSKYSIYLHHSNNDNIILKNTAFSYIDSGLHIDWFNNNNNISDNHFSNGIVGIHSSGGRNNITNNIVSDNKYGIHLSHAHLIYIISNTALNNENGIYIEESYYNLLIENHLNNNKNGILLIEAESIEIHDNIISNNSNGIHVSQNSNNISIFDNTFINNTIKINLDSDGDGVLDEYDFAPEDPKEWIDSDNDGIGDNADPDDNGNFIPDDLELFTVLIAILAIILFLILIIRLKKKKK
jgi:parallel beta-helix repeat protein